MAIIRRNKVVITINQKVIENGYLELVLDHLIK